MPVSAKSLTQVAGQATLRAETESNLAVVPDYAKDFIGRYYTEIDCDGNFAPCNELATVEVDLQIPIKPMRIVPLLFISLIENAFKHGVNSRKSSFVRIRFTAKRIKRGVNGKEVPEGKSPVCLYPGENKTA